MENILSAFLGSCLLLCAAAAAAAAPRPSNPDAFLAAVRARDAAAVRDMLSAHPGLASGVDAKGRSVLLIALFANNRGFIPPKENEVLSLIAARRDALDVFEAAGVGDARRVEELLKKDASLARAWHPIGWTALHFAGFSGAARAVEVLADHGADVHARAKTPFRNTPLQAALLTGQYDAARALLGRGADVLDRQAKGFAPIHEAALLGRTDLLELLLEHGAEINSRSDDGRTPLSEAARGGKPAAVEFLKSRGAVSGAITADLTASPD